MATSGDDKKEPEPASPPVEPAARDSLPSIGTGEDDAPPSYPDDGKVSGALRTLDNRVGMAEQGVLFGLLAVVVLSGAFQGVAGQVVGKVYLWTYELVRVGVLAIAMIGAAFASHQQRHLTMDLVSRRLPPRGRLILRLFLAALTIFVSVVLARAAWILFQQVSGETHANSILPAWAAPLTIPLGTSLIIFHTLVHLVIDVDYLVRGKLPPERVRSAH